MKPVNFKRSLKKLDVKSVMNVTFMDVASWTKLYNFKRLGFNI